MVEEHDLGVLSGRDILDLVGLAAADEVARIGSIAPAGNLRDGNGAGRERELLEFLEIFGVRGCADPETHEDGPLTCAWSLEQL